jgi:hypothetical protein
MCATMHLCYGLDEYTNKFLSMSITMHMTYGFNEHIKKYTNLIKNIFYDLYDLYRVDLVYRNLINFGFVL